MLHLNKDGAADLTLASKAEEIVWKVLVMDRKSQAVISSVLRVNDLLRCGVTVHTLLSATRAPLPDVPAIYFVEPTPQNVSVIIQDLQEEKYESFYVNFTLAIRRELLEDFAKKVSLCGMGHKIKQVYDQYLDFIVTEPNLFSLDLPRIFTQFNSPTTSEDGINALATVIADGLLAALVTIDAVPIIRCPKNGPAELVATQLDMKLRDHVANSRAAASQLIQQRPVLILLDRNIDIASMFSHSWIYQCMVSDVFELRRNTIRVSKYQDSLAQPQIKSYDVDPRDFFWNKNSQLPFPDVVENADIELNTYKKDAQELTARTGISSLNDIDPNANTDTSLILQAVEALPELTARKATLDMHMDVLASLLKELEARSLDKFFEVEQNYSNPKVQSEFLELLQSDSARDNSSDKLRTFLILTLLTELPQSFVADCEKIFASKYPEIDMSAFKYIVKFKQILNLSRNITLNEQSNSNGHSLAENNSALFTGLSSKLYGLTEGRISEGISSLASGLKKLLPEKKALPITNIVEAIVEPGNASSNSVQITDDYLYLDPKSRGGHSKPPKRQSYESAVVFVVGGGNYLEYHNLTEWSAQPNKAAKNIVYGSTDLVTAKEFLAEVSDLGKIET
ncbi:Sec1-like protein [Metschnikowia bicuspidata var. bicuspidata NRRL YB-4993]|uniref:Sec1-like protein n=1 Tax=Metschnikowia bicuspidata var. bicuspidata NRRL YB-4993 TaxID=869754 RepID=A0A1A0H9P8_9ASCO|nr:Sec1-like protein [Metschnikowia bicuspidata var. bicuspidata NRRL YB-4993]OBA20603.1 Sec1-like protein [Metschnikowia bicuspidata var. bicuspidata NRRL YB-4993]